jgi:3-hydroxy-3-methylglutaryl CoA synthase
MHPLCLNVSCLAIVTGQHLVNCLLAIHGTYMDNTYDFYKPKLDSEYPEVDGPLSVSTYIAAMDGAYTAFRTKVASASKALNGHVNGESHGKTSDPKAIFNLRRDVDYPVYHSPYGKQVQKGHARLVSSRLVRVCLVSCSGSFSTIISLHLTLPSMPTFPLSSSTSATRQLSRIRPSRRHLWP